MSYERLKQFQKDLTIGTKQTLKAMHSAEVSEVYIAKDADLKVTKKVIETARKLNIPCIEVESKKELGKACNIDVGASAVAVRLHGVKS